MTAAEHKDSDLSARRARMFDGRLPDGTPFFGQLGVLAVDEVADRVQCALCGRWLRSLGGSHLQLGHGWTAEQYREAFGLTLHRSLDCPGRNNQRAAMQRARMVSDPKIRDAIAAAIARAHNGELLRASRQADANPDRRTYQRPERLLLQQRNAELGAAVIAEHAAEAREAKARARGFTDVRAYLLERAGRDRVAVYRMATELGAAAETVAALLDEYGIPRPTQFDPAVEEQAIAASGFRCFADYLKARHSTGVTVAAMARELGHSDAWIRARAKRDGLEHLIQPSADAITRARVLATALGFARVEDFLRHRYETDGLTTRQLHDELGLQPQQIARLLDASGTVRRNNPHVDERAALAEVGYDDLTRYADDRARAGMSVTAMAAELGRSQAWLAGRLRARGLGHLIAPMHAPRIDPDALAHSLGFSGLADYARNRAAAGCSLVAMAKELGHSDTWLAHQLRTAGLGHLIGPRGRRPATADPDESS